MANTKLSRTKTPTRLSIAQPKKKRKSKKLGLLTEGKRKMSSFRLKHETRELLNSLVEVARMTVSEKISSSDIIEVALNFLSELEQKKFIKQCLSYPNTNLT